MEEKPLRGKCPRTSKKGGFQKEGGAKEALNVHRKESTTTDAKGETACIKKGQN